MDELWRARAEIAVTRTLGSRLLSRRTSEADTQRTSRDARRSWGRPSTCTVERIAYAAVLHQEELRSSILAFLAATFGSVTAEIIRAGRALRAEEDPGRQPGTREREK